MVNKTPEEPAVLNECGVDRLKSIARDLLIPNASSLKKPALMEAIREALATVDDCTICVPGDGGQCLVDEHVFPPWIRESVPDNMLTNSQNNPLRGVENSQFNHDTPPLGHESAFVRDEVYQPPQPPDLQQLTLHGGVSVGNGSGGAAEVDLNTRLAQERENLRRESEEADKARKASLAAAQQKAASQQQTRADENARKFQEQIAEMKRIHAEEQRVKDAALQASIAALQASNPAPPTRTVPTPAPAIRIPPRNDHPASGSVPRNPLHPQYETASGLSPMSLPAASPAGLDLSSLSQVISAAVASGVSSVMQQQASSIPGNPWPAPSPSSHCHSTNPSSGRTNYQSVPNPDMASRLGILPQPTFALDGDLKGVDISKLTKHLVSGDKLSGAGLVLRQANWPHHLLDTLITDPPKDHFSSSMPQFVMGFAAMILIESDRSTLDPLVANKLCFLQQFMALSIDVPWSQSLKISHKILRAWEMKQLDWSDWNFIEGFLKKCETQAAIHDY